MRVLADPALGIGDADESEQLDRPYTMVGVNIIAAGNDGEARRLATTQQMSFANMFRGTRGLSQMLWRRHRRLRRLRRGSGLRGPCRLTENVYPEQREAARGGHYEF